MKYFMAPWLQKSDHIFFSITQSYHYGVFPACQALCPALAYSISSSHHNNHIELTASVIGFLSVRRLRLPESQGQGCWIPEPNL